MENLENAMVLGGDPPRYKDPCVVCLCAHCGDDILEGQECYRFGVDYDDTYCSHQCLVEAAMMEIKCGGDELLSEVFWRAWCHDAAPAEREE